MSAIQMIKDLCSKIAGRAQEKAVSDTTVPNRLSMFKIVGGNERKAMLLNQIIYRHQLGHAWVKLSGEDAVKLAIIGCSAKTAQRYLAQMVDEGLLFRQEPGLTWARAYSYQVNFEALIQRAEALEADSVNQSGVFHTLDIMSHAQDTLSDAEDTMSHQNKSTNISNETTAVAASAVKNAVKEEEALKADFESVPATVAADDPEDRRQALNALSTVPGFAVNRAQELVKIRSLAEIQQQIEALPYRKAKDPARVLYMALKRRWSLPEAYLQRNSAPPPDSEAQSQPSVDLSAVAERLMSAAALITSQGQRLVVKHVNLAAQAVRVLLNGTEAVLTFDQALRCEIECSPA